MFTKTGDKLLVWWNSCGNRCIVVFTCNNDINRLGRWQFTQESIIFMTTIINVEERTLAKPSQNERELSTERCN